MKAHVVEKFKGRDNTNSTFIYLQQKLTPMKNIIVILFALLAIIAVSCNMSWNKKSSVKEFEKLPTDSIFTFSDPIFSDTVTTYPSIIKFNLTERTFHLYNSSLDSIILFVSFEDSYDMDPRVYMVSGWYTLNNKKKKLVGIYADTLTLYNFENEEKEKLFLSFIMFNGKPYQVIGKYNNIEDYQAKFRFAADKIVFFNEKKEFELLNPEKDYGVYKTIQLLKVGNKKHFNLKKYIPQNADVKIIGNNKNNYLLEVSYVTNASGQGFCGQSTDVNFLVLRFDDNGKLISNEMHRKDSCYEGIFAESEKAINPSTTEYLLKNDYSGEQNKLIVDRSNISVKLSKWE